MKENNFTPIETPETNKKTYIRLPDEPVDEEIKRNFVSKEDDTKLKANNRKLEEKAPTNKETYIRLPDEPVDEEIRKRFIIDEDKLRHLNS